MAAQLLAKGPYLYTMDAQYQPAVYLYLGGGRLFVMFSSEPVKVKVLALIKDLGSSVRCTQTCFLTVIHARHSLNCQ